MENAQSEAEFVLRRLDEMAEGSGRLKRDLHAARSDVRAFRLQMELAETQRLLDEARALIDGQTAAPPDPSGADRPARVVENPGAAQSVGDTLGEAGDSERG